MTERDRLETPIVTERDRLETPIVTERDRLFVIAALALAGVGILYQGYILFLLH